MKQLASKATSFHLGVEGLRGGSTGEVACLVGAAAANVVDLHLRATENELAITSILKHQLPKLSSLRVHPGSPMAFFNLGPAFGLSTANPTIPHPPSIQPARAYLPTLVNVEGPAWLLSFIHAPNLRSLSVRHLDSHLDQDGLLKALGEYPKIEDLLIHSQVGNAIVTTRIFQRIIRSLTPGDYTPTGTEKLLCPALRRLCFMARPLIIPDWLGPHAWKEYSTIPVESPMERDYPFIKGSDLLQLDKRRLEWSLKGAVETRCQPLNTIRFLDYFIDHRFWAKFLKTSKCENKWSSPDPSTENSKEAYREKYFPNVFID